MIVMAIELTIWNQETSCSLSIDRIVHHGYLKVQPFIIKDIFEPPYLANLASPIRLGDRFWVRTSTGKCAQYRHEYVNLIEIA